MSPFLPGLLTRSTARAAGLAVAGLALSASGPAVAQASSSTAVVAAAETVVVSATRSPQPLSRVLADVSVLERDAIERSGAACVADLLVRLPGVALSRNGGAAGVTSLYVRGGESRHTAIYIDGLRVDSQSTGGATWEAIPVEQIERVELLRGPAAAVYGSDAVNGVVHLTTRRGQRALQAGAALGVGSQATYQGSGSVSGMLGPLDYALNASQGRSEGFNALLTPSANPDRDGWRRSGLQARAGLDVATGHRLEAALLASRLRGQYDGFSKTADDVATHTLQTVGVNWQGRWSPEADTRVQLGQTEATSDSQPSYYRTETTLRHLVLQHNQRIAHHDVGLTLERREDELLNPATAFAAQLTGQRHQDAIGLSVRADVGAHAFLGQVRHDRDSQFGGHGTGSLAWGWQVGPALRVSASAATSFRAPTLYQRFSEYGVASLQPETGRNLELALRWQQGPHEASATVFRNRIRNLINFGAAGPCASTFGCYANTGRATSEGLTLAGATRLAGVGVRGSLDVQDPRDDDLNRLLRRRARLFGQVAVDTHLSGWGLGLEVQGSGKRYEDAANKQAMGGYALVNLSAERALAKGLTLQVRVDNLADKAYETARTYAMSGRSVTLGLRWALR